MPIKYYISARHKYRIYLAVMYEGYLKSSANLIDLYIKRIILTIIKYITSFQCPNFVNVYYKIVDKDNGTNE